MPTRFDLSEWVIHFVHDRDPELDPRNVLSSEDERAPGRFHVDHEVNERFAYWDVFDDEYPIEPDAGAYAVLKKILNDGHIRCGWSFRTAKERSPRATIYGPKAACCFTEMPLYALMAYARGRADDSRVAAYGIALRRNEFFAAGGRPVIYGLSTEHKEIGDPIWPRILAPACGIGDAEQYRYVATNFAEGRRIDWSHERECRWAIGEGSSTPGLPLWLDEEPDRFSTIAVFVPKRSMALDLVGYIKRLHDTGGTEFDVPYRRETLKRVAVFSLEECEAVLGEDALNVVRIEDLPTHLVSGFRVPKPTAETIANVRAAVVEARAAAATASAEYLRTAARDAAGHVLGPFGGAYVTVSDPQSEVTQALLDLEEARMRLGSYAIHIHGELVDDAEAGAHAAQKVLARRFPQLVFSVSSYLD